MRENLWVVYHIGVHDAHGPHHRPVAKFLLTDSGFELLEDREGLFDELHDASPQKIASFIHSLSQARHYEVLNFDAVAAGKHPAVIPEHPGASEAKPTSSFLYHRQGLESPQELHFVAGVPYLDGHHLSDAELALMHQNVKSGDATLKYPPKAPPPEAVDPMTTDSLTPGARNLGAYRRWLESLNNEAPQVEPGDKAAHPHDDSMWVEDLHAPEEELQKSKKDAEQMYGADHPGTATKKEHLAWAYGKMPNENWSLWTVRHHRAAPQDFTPEIKSKIEHFAGSQHIPEVAAVRFEKHHSLQDGLNILDAAEKQYINRQKSSLQLAPKPKTAKKIMDFGDGYAWWSLGRSSCSKEGKAMGHCGNVPSEMAGDDVVSLRKEHILGGKKYYEPHLTFIRNGDIFGEMKGRGNEKPAPHYHDKIVALLNKTQAHPLGGGYMPASNFSLDDLSPEHRAQVKLKPLQWDSNLEDRNKKLKLGSKDLPPEVLTQALGDKDWDVRLAAIKHPLATADHVTQALGDKHEAVRLAAIKHPLATADHVTQALGDKHWHVREAAIKHPLATADHVTQALEDEDGYIRRVAIQHPAATADHVTRALGDGSRHVREAAIKHPLATADHVTQALEDEDKDVREAAQDKAQGLGLR